MKTTKQSGLWNKIKRLVRYRLYIPIIRNKQPDHIVARGVMIGMMWAMTPFFGLHMTFVFMTWLISRKVFKWDFDLINGLAWTWTTNVLTVLPAFYLFYVTGQFLLGHTGDPVGYENFRSIFIQAEQDAVENPVNVWTQLSVLWSAFGLPLFLGSAVWSAISGWVSYWLAYGFVTRYRAHRSKCMDEAKQKNRKTVRTPLSKAVPSDQA